MTSQQLEVAKWMRAFGQETPDAPCVPSIHILELRFNLIQEEMKETLGAIHFLKRWSAHAPQAPHPTLEDLIDGLCDSLVVIYGTFVTLGIDAEPFFTEVMRSNWSKLWTGIEAEDIPLECIAEEVGSGERRWLVKRNDGKIIKSPSYSPPNLLPLIEAQMKKP